MKKIYSLLFLCVMFLTQLNTKASHISGGEISIVYTGIPNTFIFRYKYDRDCNGIPSPTQIPICYSSVSCSISGTLDLFPIPNTGNPLMPSPCFPSPPGGTTCNGGTGLGVQEWIFEGTLVFPANCTDWNFSYLECCRNAVGTITNAGFYIDADFDNLNFPTNSAPVFNTLPPLEICINNPQYYDAGAIDLDGDSLVFSLINSRDGMPGCPHTPFDVTYLSPYSGINPLSTVNGITIDPQTGVLYFTPDQVQIAAIAVRCKEYDRTSQQLKSIVNRDFQVFVTNTCIANTPTYDSTLTATGINIEVDGNSNTACDDTVFYIYLEPPIQCSSIVPSDIRFRDVIGNNNPVVSAVGIDCQLGLTDSIRITVLNPIMAGTSYIITKIGNDGNTFLSECGSPMDELDTLYIHLIDSSKFLFSTIDSVGCVFDSLIVTSSQLLNCNTFSNGSDFLLIDANGVIIPITSSVCNGQSPSGLFSNNFALYTQVNSGITGPLSLIAKNGTDNNTISNACGTFIQAMDTLVKIPVRNTLTVNAGNDINCCVIDTTVQLFAGLFPAYINYSWMYNAVPINANNAYLPLLGSGTYTITVSSSPKCFSTDTILVNLLPSPVVELGSDVLLCSSYEFPVLDAGNPGSQFQWYYETILLSNDTLQLYEPNAAGIYYIQVTSDNSCLGYDTIQITFAPDTNFVITIIDTISNSSYPASYCFGVNVPVLSVSNSVSGLLYSWSNNGFTSVNSTVTIDSIGIYSVIVTNTYGCTATDDILVFDGCGLKLPNVFTPNGDGMNDFFEVQGIENFSLRKLTVYNRWGAEVFNANPYQNDWDGGNLSSGIYSFFYTLELSNGITAVVENGHLQIIK